MFLIYSLLFTLALSWRRHTTCGGFAGIFSRVTDWRERLGFLPDSLQQAAVARQAGDRQANRLHPGHDRRALSGSTLCQSVKPWLLPGWSGNPATVPRPQNLYESRDTGGRETGEKRLPCAGASATGGEHTGPAIPPRLAGRFFFAAGLELVRSAES